MIKFFKLYFLDILNYIYFRRVVSKFNSTETWKRLNLRQNQIGEIYTVVRLRDEDLGDPDEIMTTRLMEIAKDKNIFIADMDLQFSVGGLVVVDYYHYHKANLLVNLSIHYYTIKMLMKLIVDLKQIQ